MAKGIGDDVSAMPALPKADRRILLLANSRSAVTLAGLRELTRKRFTAGSINRTTKWVVLSRETKYAD